MAILPKSICRHPGCGKAIDASGYCEKHASDAIRQTDAKKAADRQRRRGYATNSVSWRKIRLRVLQEQPLCLECLWHGSITPATDVDHIDNDSFNNKRENLAALCHRHHARKTAIEQNGDRYLLPLVAAYNTPKVKGEIVIVCGSPAAGKTTYIQNNKNDGDIVIDMDAINSDICVISTETDRQRLIRILEERNKRLKEAALSRKKVWFIASAPYQSHRDWWQNMLGGEIILLDVPLSVCLERIDATRSGWRRTQSIEAAYRWHEKYGEGRGKSQKSLPSDTRSPVSLFCAQVSRGGI